MKYYEIRCNRSNTKVCLLRHGLFGDKGGRVVYEGDFAVLKAFKPIGNNLFVPEFKDTEKVSLMKLRNLGFNEEMSSNLRWVLEDSDHRVDVRIIDENEYNRILDNESSMSIVYDCNHLNSGDNIISLETKYIIASVAYHSGRDVSIPEGHVAIVSQTDGENYIGQWDSSCMVNVIFPINGTIEITKEEFLKIRSSSLNT